MNAADLIALREDPDGAAWAAATAGCVVRVIGAEPCALYHLTPKDGGPERWLLCNEFGAPEDTDVWPPPQELVDARMDSDFETVADVLAALATAEIIVP